MSADGSTRLPKWNGVGDMASYKGFSGYFIPVNSILPNSLLSYAPEPRTGQRGRVSPKVHKDHTSAPPRIVAFSAEEPSVSYDGLTFGKVSARC